MNLSPTEDLSAYENYPVLINCLISLPSDVIHNVELVEYSPQTVNTKIHSSSVNGSTDGQTNSRSSSNTVGSSTSQTNSYGATISTESASINYEHSATVAQERSSTVGNEFANSRTQDASESAAMSMKDWGAYALINAATKTPSWSFGQEYPWDCIVCRKTDDERNPKNNEQTKIVLPGEMIARLYDGASLCPPSQLAMFGFNFVMKVVWLVTVADESASDIAVKHSLNFFSGSHAVVDKKVGVYLDKQPAVLTTDDTSGLTTTLNLPIMALDPLGVRQTSAVVGFVPARFFVPPARSTLDSPASRFIITSTANNLLIIDNTVYPSPSPSDVGLGFDMAETALSATFTKNCTALKIVIYFKVVDTSSDYSLFVKHWKAGKSGVKLTLSINGDETSSIKKYIDDGEAIGGEKNLLSIALRNQDYASVDYSDYLQLGLNSVEITIEPLSIENLSDCVYQIRAISIE
jgi:hypothetical protein